MHYEIPFTDCNAASRPKDAVAAMIKRLSHRNANVQLYTLEVWSTRNKSTKLLMMEPASECSFTKLRPQDPPGISLEEFHRSRTTPSKRSSKLGSIG